MYWRGAWWEGAGGVLEGLGAWNQVVEVLLDAGSARTLARGELVPEGKVMEDRAVPCPLCSWRKCTVPYNANVSLETAWRTFTVQAEHLPVLTLLGLNGRLV